MSRRAVDIWVLVAIELVVAVMVFLLDTTPMWQRGVHGRNDDFRGAYRRIFASTSLKQLSRACRSPNAAEYWGAFWLEHLIAGLGVWVVWRRYMRGKRDGSPVFPQVPCPHCGYNVVGQVRAGIGRCSECGSSLTVEEGARKSSVPNTDR